MIRRMTLKRMVKQSAGWAATHWPRSNGARSGRQACILMYHRVAAVPFVDPRIDDWNVPPQSFERQIAALSECAEVVFLTDLRQRLAETENAASAKPLVAITFDDGYANFFTEALPVLQRYDVPATVFVVTSEVGEPGPLQFDAWSRKHHDDVPADFCRSLNWDEVESCLDTELVDIGAHSHRHFKGTECTPEQLLAEAQQSRKILQDRLGDRHCHAYAYPYGSSRLGFVPPAYVDAVRRAGYQLAVTTDMGMVSSQSDPFLLPRVEAHALDNASVIQAKSSGTLAPYHLVDRLRRRKRAI